jgi:hypothetical protein
MLKLTIFNTSALDYKAIKEERKIFYTCSYVFYVCSHHYVSVYTHILYGYIYICIYIVKRERERGYWLSLAALTGTID